jgi:hypothetical protein
VLTILFHPAADRLTGAAYRSASYPNLNPILAADATLLRFDIRKKPRTEILASTYYSERNSPATANGTTRMRLICKAFPWSIDIDVPSRTPVTCEAVWDALFKGLQEDIKDSEWGLIVSDGKRREIVEKAAKKRREEGSAEDKRLKRIDYLGDTTFFKGLYKDEDFEQLRLMPGEKDIPQTWVIKLSA